NIPGEGASDLISYLDGIFGVATTSTNYAARPWFGLLEESFDRWSELGGVEFIYEPTDNGSQLQSSRGVLNTRGDVRLGGAYIDGANATLAYTWLPESGDIVFDTGETSFYANQSNNYRALRNTLMHEIGHAIGLLHVESSSESLLMEPYSDATIDGPQLDDVRGLHGLYGDYYEKSNGGLGNGTASLATYLGSLTSGTSLSVGTDAASGQSISPAAVDFVSIANSADVDFFSFEVDSAGTLSLTLTPLGGVFQQGVEGGAQTTFDASARNDLALEIYGSDGVTRLAAVDQTQEGGSEVLADLILPAGGTYYAKVSGALDNVQLFELQASFEAPNLAGDFNYDLAIDGSDLLVWQQRFGGLASGSFVDADGNGLVDATDLAIWQRAFGSASVTAGVAAVPEPSGLIWLAALTLGSRLPRRHYRRGRAARAQ
ncbi:MAG: matrixin family metalloprotease, partial [Planctomycetales bacterium]|nr:matrixin family metalloprotease [Planctomycetales bacterium]